MINLFIIDDSATARIAIANIVEKEPDITLLGVAPDPIFALEKFKKKGWPDVIILDIEMPRMDGIAFLKKLMIIHPIPVIICSSVVQHGSPKSIKAMSLGAVDIVIKPTYQIKDFFEEKREDFLQTIRAASKSKLKNISKTEIFINQVEEKMSADVIIPAINKSINYNLEEKYVAIGSSTGGVQILEAIITKLPKMSVPILIVQHMPEGFTSAFTNRLNRLSKLHVKEAVSGDKLTKGSVYIARGGVHMMIKNRGNGLFIEIKDGPKVSRHKPSVDVLFRSCANESPQNCVAFILTGMGDDGAMGMKELFDKGATTYAQDEKSSIVYGMPKEAVMLGGVKKSVNIEEIVGLITNLN